MVTKEDVRAFLDRRWDLVREAKDRYLAQLVVREGPEAAFDLAAKLRAQATAMGVRPTQAQRDADLETAVRIRRVLDRADRRSRRHR